jgi:Skp family chaperone for outer membrane proteins
MAKTAVALIVWLCLAFSAAAAQPAKQAVKPVRPAWTELSAAQQQVLAPLAAEWNGMDSARRKRWVAIADRYPKMKPAEQQRLQKRMKDWAALTPEQRQQVRERYKKLPEKQRREMSRQWQAYRKSLAQPETQFDPAIGDPLPSGSVPAER